MSESCFANSLPIPVDAPVIKITLLLKFMFYNIPLAHCYLFNLQLESNNKLS
jgi:hypothetical protein